MNPVDLNFNNMQNKVTSTTQIMPDQPAIIYDIDLIAHKVPAIQQFLNFQSETENLQLTIIESVNNAYICRFFSENETCYLILFDIRGGDQTNLINLSDQALNMLFNEASPTSRIFFIDSESTYIMEVRSNFLNQCIVIFFWGVRGVPHSIKESSCVA